MTRGDDDTPDDMNSIADMIRGSKKKEAVPEQPDEAPAAPAAPRSGPAPDSGDFSILMKKLGMAAPENLLHRKPLQGSHPPVPEKSRSAASMTCSKMQRPLPKKRLLRQNRIRVP